MNIEKKAMYKQMGISEEVYEFSEKIWNSLSDRFAQIDAVSEYNQLKVIGAMQKNRVSEACLLGTTGYGYNDLGRDTLEAVYADIFHTEDALVRPQITCGTHALALALMSNLRPGDELLSPVGKPYDTLEEVIGIRESKGSLKEYGISYRQVDLLPDGSFDFEGIARAINGKTKLVTIQRSKGYQTRPTLSVERIEELITFIKERKPDVICMVDNCYGEFTEAREPSDVGADLVVGSLIKNPGGGLAPIGGYLAGKKECIENAIRAHRNILVIGGTGSGKTTFTNAVTKLITRYNELSNKLDSYSSIPALIGNYKSISKEINDLQQELSFLSEEEIDRKQLLQNEINNDYQALQNVLSQITNKIL